MSVPELSVQLKNIPGQLTQVTAILAESNINIRGIAASSTGKIGWVRLVVDNAKVAAEALEDCGFTVDIGEAVAMKLFDEPGTLDNALRILSDARLNVDYIYTCSGKSTRTQLVIFGVQSPSKAEALLRAADVDVVDIND